jgi:hypothetical protein
MTLGVDRRGPIRTSTAARGPAGSRAVRAPGASASWLENRLVPLGFRLVFCVRSPDSFERARAARLLVSGNPAQYSDLTAFISEQDLIRDLVRRSTLPSLTLDISNNDVALAATQAADWLEQTGGLYAPALHP